MYWEARLIKRYRLRSLMRIWMLYLTITWTLRGLLTSKCNQLKDLRSMLSSSLTKAREFVSSHLVSTLEKERAYSLPEWDMDSENNLIDRPVAENSGKVDEDQEFEGQTETDNKDEPHHESAADEDLINDHKIHLKRVYSAAKAMKAQTAMSLNRQYAHNENISNSHSWTYYAMLFELLCFLGILGFQMHHIKKTLDNKLVL